MESLAARRNGQNWATQRNKILKKFPDLRKIAKRQSKRVLLPRPGSEAVGRGLGAKKFTLRMDSSHSLWGSSVNDLEFFGLKTKIENWLQISICKFQELTHTNTKLAVMEAVERITTEDMAGFFEGTSHLFVWIVFWNFRILWSKTGWTESDYYTERGRSAHLPQLS